MLSLRLRVSVSKLAAGFRSTAIHTCTARPGYRCATALSDLFSERAQRNLCICPKKSNDTDQAKMGSKIIDEGSLSVKYHDHRVTWVDRMPPASIPYLKLARLDRPAGVAMLLWPCYWSIALAAPAGHMPDVGLMATFGAGALIMRGAGCTINDMWDKDFDRQVERTAGRPLASGTVTQTQAAGFLLVQLLGGLAVLLSLNTYSIVLGAASLGLVVVYPLMKRYTDWPQFVLGLAFNWGALLGWAAVHGSCNWGVLLPLYAAGISWTLVYDTLYAHQDKQFDKKLGLRSTALLFGDQTKPILLGFSAFTTTALSMVGYLMTMPAVYYVGVGIGASHLVWQVTTSDINDADNLATRFAMNNTYGGIIFSTIVAGILMM